MPRNYLIILTGPTSSGKSSTAASLAAVLRTRGVSTAVVEYDALYKMGRQHPDKWDEPEMAVVARRACGALAESFLVSGLRSVIIEGPFFLPEQFDEIRTCVPQSAETRTFTLVVSRDVMLRRARDDPRWDPPEPWLVRMHEKLLRSLDYLREVSVCVDADVEIEERAALIASDVLGVPEEGENETV